MNAKRPQSLTSVAGVGASNIRNHYRNDAGIGGFGIHSL